VEYVPGHPLLTDDSELLFEVEPAHRGFSLSACSRLGGEEIWESLRNREQDLADKDVVKIGRLQLQLHMNSSENDFSETTNSEESSDSPFEALCRICLAGDEGETENPLISPCNCSGSMKYIHYQCLSCWLQSKMVVRSFQDFQLFHWKALECELCKKPLPRVYTSEGTSMSLCKAPSEPTIIIDCYNKEKTQNRGLMILSMKEQANVRIGRGHESDLRISDISVSRSHASLRKNGDQFTLRDLSSKFGTLLLMNSPQLITLNSPLHIQVGRSYFILEVKPGNYPVQPDVNCDSEDEFTPDELEIS